MHDEGWKMNKGNAVQSGGEETCDVLVESANRMRRIRAMARSSKETAFVA